MLEKFQKVTMSNQVQLTSDQHKIRQILPLVVVVPIRFRPWKNWWRVESRIVQHRVHEKMSHRLWIIVLVQIAKVIMVLLIWPLLTSQCKCHTLLKQKLCEHPTPCEGYQILYHIIYMGPSVKTKSNLSWMYLFFEEECFRVIFLSWAFAEAFCETILR